MLAGRYPDAARGRSGALTDFSFLHDGDLEMIAAPLDFLGVNYYFPSRIVAADYAEPDPAKRPPTTSGRQDCSTRTKNHRDGLAGRSPTGSPGDADLAARDLPALPPVYITENGRACADIVDEHGVRRRPGADALSRRASARTQPAIDAGVDVRGYLLLVAARQLRVGRGYAMRFGLVYADYLTQRRIPKASYHWLRGVIAAAKGATR